MPDSLSKTHWYTLIILVLRNVSFAINRKDWIRFDLSQTLCIEKIVKFKDQEIILEIKLKKNVKLSRTHPSAVSIPRVRVLLAGRWESQLKHLTPSTGRFQVEAQD